MAGHAPSFRNENAASRDTDSEVLPSTTADATVFGRNFGDRDPGHLLAARLLVVQTGCRSADGGDWAWR